MTKPYERLDAVSNEQIDPTSPRPSGPDFTEAPPSPAQSPTPQPSAEPSPLPRQQPSPQPVPPQVAPTPSYPAPNYGPAPYEHSPYPDPYAQNPYGSQPGYGAPGYGAQYSPPTGYGMLPYGMPGDSDDPRNPDAPKRGVGPVEAYKRFWSRGLRFTGRASQSEYWWAMLVNTAIVYGPAVALSGSTGFLTDAAVSFSVLYMLAAIIPSLAVMVRRFHDSNNSGALALLNLIPFIGWIITMIFMLLPGHPMGARYDRQQPWRG